MQRASAGKAPHNGRSDGIFDVPKADGPLRHRYNKSGVGCEQSAAGRGRAQAAIQLALLIATTRRSAGDGQFSLEPFHISDVHCLEVNEVVEQPKRHSGVFAVALKLVDNFSLPGDVDFAFGYMPSGFGQMLFGHCFVHAQPHRK